MRKQTILSLAFLLLGATSIATAQINRSEQPQSGPVPSIQLEDPQTFTLKNGLTVMLVENHKLPRVSVQLILDNPPVLEGDKAGVSSLFSSMMGNGTTNRSKDTFNEEVDFMGASINFGASSASASGLSKYFDRLVELMADAVKNPLLTQAEFEKEQEKIITGIKSEEKDVKAIARRLESAVAYGTDHPNGEFVTETTVKNNTLADVTSFYQTQFVPNKGYLIVIGDIDVAAAKKTISKQFGDWKKSSATAATWKKPEATGKTAIHFVDMPNAVQSEVTVQNLVDLPMKSPDYLSALLANNILGGSASARLFMNLREDKAFTYGSYSSLGSSKYTPARFRAYASVRNAVTDSAAVELLSEIDRMAQEPVSQDELAMAKAEYVGNFVMALENPATVANYAFRIASEGLPKDFYKTYLSRINSVTPEEVQAAARKYFTADNAQVVVAGKGRDVLPALEKMTFKGQPLTVNYYTPLAEKAEKPNYDAAIPEGLSADQVIADYIEAVGGRALLESVSSLRLLAEGTVQGMTINVEITRTQGQQFKQKMSLMGNVMSEQVFNGESGYVSMQGQKIPMQDKDIVQVRQEAMPFPELGMSGATLEGVEDVNGQKAYKVKLSANKWAYYSVDNGLKLKEVTAVDAGGQTMESAIEFGDYEIFQGILMPFTLKQQVGPQAIDLKIKEVYLNEALTPASFQ